MKFGQKICDIIHKLHKKGIIYGNLHPNCILVGDGELKFVGLEYSTTTISNDIIEFDNFH